MPQSLNEDLITIHTTLHGRVQHEGNKCLLATYGTIGTENLGHKFGQFGVCTEFVYIREETGYSFNLSR